MEDRASKTKGLLWLIAGCLLGVLFAFGLSPLAHAVPWSWEKKMGDMLPETMPEATCNPTQESRQLLQKLVTRIYPVQPDDNSFSIEVRMVKNPAVNAYAALGGNITVNSGLLKKAESPEELAGVLAHEMEHVHSRHIMEGAITHMFTSQGIGLIFGDTSGAAQWTQYFLNMSFTRRQEEQADRGGLKRLQKAHVDNQGFRHFFERMEKSSGAAEFLSDHPSNESRIEEVASFANDHPTPIMSAEEWNTLKSYCGK